MDPQNQGQYKRNSEILQALAFVALTSYVFEKNNYNRQRLSPCSVNALPAHEAAMDSFMGKLRAYDSWGISDVGFPTNDAVKWVSTIQNLARMFDLYLAIENAYEYYGDENSDRLVSLYEKTDLVRSYNRALDYYEDMAGGFWIFQNSPVDGYDLQAGNWPMEVQTALGYAIMGTQSPFDHPQVDDFGSWLRRAYRAAGEPCPTQRDCYWAFNTGGQAYWAEGPYYFELTLDTMVSFWHAARINGHLGSTPLADYSPTSPST